MYRCLIYVVMVMMSIFARAEVDVRWGDVYDVTDSLRSDNVYSQNYVDSARHEQHMVERPDRAYIYVPSGESRTVVVKGDGLLAIKAFSRQYSSVSPINVNQIATWTETIQQKEYVFTESTYLYIGSDQGGNGTTVSYTIQFKQKLAADIQVLTVNVFHGLSSKSTMLDDMNLYVEFDLNNVGEVNTGRFTVEVFVDNASVGAVNVGDLPGGSRIQEKFQLGKFLPGRHVVRIKADSGNCVAELSETNNEGSDQVSVYDRVPYAVRFDKNGGAGDMPDQQFVNGVKQPMQKGQFQREGYKFMGWALTPDGTVAYHDGETVGNLVFQGGGIVTLYAVWEENQILTIHFASYGVSNLMPDLIFTNGFSQMLRKNEFARDEYVFAGWSLDDCGFKFDSQSRAYADGAVVSQFECDPRDKDITLYACWGHESSYKGEAAIGGDHICIITEGETCSMRGMEKYDVQQRYNVWTDSEMTWRGHQYQGIRSDCGSWMTIPVRGAGRLEFLVIGYYKNIEEMKVVVDGTRVNLQRSNNMSVDIHRAMYRVEIPVVENVTMSQHLIYVESATFSIYDVRWCPDSVVFLAEGGSTNVLNVVGLKSTNDWLTVSFVGAGETTDSDYGSKYATTWRLTAMPNNSLYDRVAYVTNDATDDCRGITVVQAGLPHEEVTFDTQDGQISVVWFAKDAVYGELPVPQSVDRVFDGWYTSPSGGRLVTVTDRVVSGILYAHWKMTLPGNAYAILFDGNVGTGTMSAKVCELGKIYTLTKCSFTPPSGKTRFAGWACSNGRRYDDGMLVFNLAKPGETVTMTAIWE